MLSYEVRSITSSVSERYVNGVGGSRSESDVTSDVTSTSTDPPPSVGVVEDDEVDEMTEDSISLQLSNLLDNLQVT